MFARRSAVLFSGLYTCTIWVNLFQLLTRMSIALTATLSVSRTSALLFPLKHINKQRIYVALGCYASFILLETVLPCILGLQYGIYNFSGASCWLLPHSSTLAGEVWDLVDNIVDCLALAAPIIPVGISCCLSSYKMLNTPPELEGLTAGVRMKRRATETILIFTAVYFIFSLPLFVNYIFWMITAVRHTYPGPYYSSRGMYNYAWNITEVLSVALNSLCNPVIYFTRIAMFRDYVCRRGAA